MAGKLCAGRPPAASSGFQDMLWLTAVSLCFIKYLAVTVLEISGE